MTTVLAFLLVLGGLIIVHEAGHFVVAKAFRIRVEKFFVGFGPVLFSRVFGETEYGVRILPLGGYVKLTGENPEEAEEPTAPADPRAFSSKPYWMQILVYLAGPMANVVFAVAAVWLMLWIGGERQLVDESATLGELVPGEPAQLAGLKPGDRLLTIDDSLVTTWLQMATVIRSRPDKEVPITFIRGTDTLVLPVKIKGVTSPETGSAIVGKIGVYPRFEDIHYGPIVALRASLQKNLAVTLEIYRYLGRYISRQVPSNQLGGPIAIAQMAGESAKLGMVTLILFMALISINLAIVNLLPIPIADGGQILLAAVQWVIRRPLSLKLRMAFQLAGLVFMLALFVFVTVNDIGRLLK